MKVLYIILLLYKISRAENNETKLIDLLPEKEKADFLDSIARRILEEVQSKDGSHKVSVELSDDQLSQHDEYVQKILKEESQNLRKKADETAKTNPEPVTDVSSDKKNDVRSEDRYIDLTLRADHRNKRENNRRVLTDEESSDNIKPDSGSETEVDIQVKNFRRSIETTVNEEIETTTQTENIFEDIKTSTQHEVEIKDEDTNTAIQGRVSNDENTTHEPNLDSILNTTDDKKENDSVENVTITDNIEVISDNTSPAIDDNEKNSNYQHTGRSIENKTFQSGQRISSSNKNNVELNVDDTYDIKQNNSVFNETVDDLADSKVINIEVTSATKNIIHDQDKYIPTGEIKVLTTTLSPTTAKLLMSNDKTDITANMDNAETLFSPDSSDFHINVDKVHNSLVEPHEKNQNSGNPPIARQNPETKQDAHFHDLKAQYEKNKIKAYEVYEISPEATPFVKQDITKVSSKTTKKPATDEQPFYVPVYNFKPENAFFDSHNIYGHNSDSDREKDFYTMNTSIEKDKIKNYKINKDIYTLIYKYSPKNAFYNSHNVYGPNIDLNDEKISYILKDDDHVDKLAKYDITEDQTMVNDGVDIKKNNVQWDYYFSNGREFQPKLQTNAPETDTDHYPGRMGIKKQKDFGCGKFSCGKKDEETTKKSDCDTSTTTEFDPFVTNHVNPEYLGDSIRHLRQVLLEQKVFSFIKPAEEHHALSDELEKMEAKDLSILRGTDSKSKGKTQHDITVDYYFGRSRSDDQIIEEEPGLISKDSNKPEYFHTPVEFYKVLELKRTSDDDEQPEILENDDPQPKIPEQIKTEIKKHIDEEYKDEKHKSEKLDYSIIKKIMDMVPSGTDLVTTLLKLQKLYEAKKSQRTIESKDIDIIATVLGDMVQENNKALEQYAWLETAVDLQSAIKKMVDLVDGVRENDNIHPSDMELLKYLVYLHTHAKAEQKEHTSSKGSRTLLPRSKKKKGIITQSGLLNRAWLIRMFDKIRPISKDELNDFGEFLDDLQEAFYDFHTALKYIAMVTTHKNQRWFENIKQLFIEPNKKQLLQIMLHLWSTRVLGLIEETAKNGLEDDFLSYVKKNEKEVKRTKEEFVFVLKLIEEINSQK